jgi:hypothetical protein
MRAAGGDGNITLTSIDGDFTVTTLDGNLDII